MRPEDPPLQPVTERPSVVPPELRGLEQVAWLMDRAFTIPGTQIKVGLDAILGLLPVGGDVLTGVVQTGIVMVAMAHYKVPKAVAARMAANVLIDIAVGAVPLIGDLFDVAFKANTRNMKLLVDVQQQRAARQQVSSAGSLAYLFAVGAVLFGAVALALVGFITVVAWLFRRPLF